MDAVFRALADPTRREILHLLRGGPRPSGEIAAHFASSWPTISRHLGVLREAGLITAVRAGQQVVYEVNTTVFQDFLAHVFAWAPTRTDAPHPDLRPEER